MRLHLTNVTGAGASVLLSSLLPAMERNKFARINCIYLPNKGYLKNYRSKNKFLKICIYNRFLPNIVSRFLECTFLSYKFNGPDPLLVFGDIPLRVKCYQTVFVHQSHLLQQGIFTWKSFYFKYMIQRLIFRLNLSKVNAFIVQSNIMKDRLEASYPSAKGKVHVVEQSVPIWLLNAGIKRVARINSNKSNLQLIYPSFGYPHKNHKLLSKIKASQNYPISEVIITIDKYLNPAPHIPWVKCVGFLTPKELMKMYSNVDGLIFLSKEESYGFPLVEAMFIGLPIICPNLPYARSLCGEQAIYFNPDSQKSLMSAIKKLKKILDNGWWPSWGYQIKNIPGNWDIVAKAMTQITYNFNKLKKS
jgi:glycosyltransferase involved in cell wall biosynthesis